MYKLRYAQEIKIRFIYILLSCFISLIISIYFSEQILYFLTSPLKKAYELNYYQEISSLPKNIKNTKEVILECYNRNQPNFIFTELSEALFTRIKLSIFITFYCSIFITGYQFWLYIKSGLFEFEKTSFIKWYLFSLALFLFSNVCLFYIILPTACKFFISLETNSFSTSSSNFLDFIGNSIQFLSPEEYWRRLKVNFFLKFEQLDFFEPLFLTFFEIWSYCSFLKSVSIEIIKDFFPFNSSNTTLNTLFTSSDPISNYSKLQSSLDQYFSKQSFENNTQNDLLNSEHGDTTKKKGLGIHLEARIYPYLIFVIQTLFWVHLFFQIPILFLFLLKWKILNINILKKNRKSNYVFILLITSLISPPELLTQLFFVGLASFFYEVCIFIALFEL